MIDRVTYRCSQIRWAVIIITLSISVGGHIISAKPLGEQVYNDVCIGCHQIGILGAPKFGDVTDWAHRFKKGIDVLVTNASNGVGKMPPKGGNPNLAEQDLRAAIQYMAGDAAKETPNDSAEGVAVVPVPVPNENVVAGAIGSGKRGAQVVKEVCKACHEIGVLGAPRIGSKQDWEPRMEKGLIALVKSAEVGIGNMPPKGGNANLSEDDIRDAIRYMLAPPAEEKLVAVPVVAAPVEPSPAEPPAPAKPNANRFNRLLKPLKERNLPPPQDGIHDPDNEGTYVLQSPRVAFDTLPKGRSGNYVDWVKALEEAAIDPRWDLADPEKKPMLMDLNIVREVKGTMPDVVYPHKQHLEWLDCSNCHPKIFIPKKGANQISMAEIIMGGKCGVCHGKVAFPITDCRRCHSKRKPNLAKK